MIQVFLTPEADSEFRILPHAMKHRVEAVIERLVHWPHVSGVKWLKHEWSGHARLRAGDWRVIFTFEAPNVIVVRIMHRSKVYED